MAKSFSAYRREVLHAGTCRWRIAREDIFVTTKLWNDRGARARENFNISVLPEDALDEINRIQTRQRFNEVVKTGSPGFIPQGRRS